MAKPRIFVGSSVESLAVANAVHRNLQHTAEVTVWTQGVFQASRSALESLLAALETQDFGLFVFSSDDVVNVRGESGTAVRDNVIFELGLFVGKLGRDRCFILVPSTASDLRIPSDLIGTQPIKFEADRRDGNLLAATGPASSEVSDALTKLGSKVQVRETDPATPQVAPHNQMTDPQEVAGGPLDGSRADDDEQKFGWLRAFFDGHTKRALELAQKRLSDAADDEERVRLRTWIGKFNYELDPAVGEAELRAAMTSSNPFAYLLLAFAQLERGLTSEAIATSDAGLAATGKEDFVRVRADAYLQVGDRPAAIKLLEDTAQTGRAEAATFRKLADLYSDSKEFDRARIWLDKGTLSHPSDKDLLRSYANLLSTHFDKPLALLPFNAWVELDKRDAEALTLRANLYLELECYSFAFRDYEKANEIADSKQGWILGNIGNVLNARGFHHAAIQRFEAGLAVEPKSKYMHERLAEAIEKRDEESARLEKAETDAQTERNRWRFSGYEAVESTAAVQ